MKFICFKWLKYFLAFLHLWVETIYLGILKYKEGKRDVDTAKGGDRQRLRVKTTRLIQLLPLQMLLLNPKNMVIAL